MKLWKVLHGFCSSRSVVTELIWTCALNKSQSETNWNWICSSHSLDLTFQLPDVTSISVSDLLHFCFWLSYWECNVSLTESLLGVVSVSRCCEIVAVRLLLWVISVNHCCFVVVSRFCESSLWVVTVSHFCELLWLSLWVVSCESFLWVVAVSCCSELLLWVVVVSLCCDSFLWVVAVSHSCESFLWDCCCESLWVVSVSSLWLVAVSLSSCSELLLWVV